MVAATQRRPCWGWLGCSDSTSAAATCCIVAGQLGSDVPFFLLGGTALGIGRGSEVYPLEELPKRHVLLAIPSRGISTAEAYGRLSLQLTNTDPESMIPRFCSGFWASLERQKLQENDFEPAFFEHFPELRKVKA